MELPNRSFKGNKIDYIINIPSEFFWGNIFCSAPGMGTVLNNQIRDRVMGNTDIFESIANEYDTSERIKIAKIISV